MTRTVVKGKTVIEGENLSPLEALDVVRYSQVDWDCFEIDTSRTLWRRLPLAAKALFICAAVGNALGLVLYVATGYGLWWHIDQIVRPLG